MGKMFTVLRAMDTYTGRTHYHYDGLAGCITHILAHNGGDVRVWKASEAGYDTEGGPFVTVCHTHGTIHNWKLLRAAIARAPQTEWCEACHEDGCNAVRAMDAFGKGESEPKQPAECAKCGRPRKALYNVGTAAYQYWICGTCQHRQERRINTKEMYGHGRRGY